MKASLVLQTLKSGLKNFSDAAGVISSNFEALRRLLQNNLSFADNFDCDVITGTFDSGVPRACSLTHILAAKGAIVLGSSAPIIAAPIVSMNGSQATVTLFFAGLIKGQTATVLLFDIGTVGSPYGSLLATTNLPGLVRPDGTTVTINNGVISSVGGSPPVVVPGAGTWDHDFSLDTTFDFRTLSTGTITISGATFYYFNASGGASQFEILNGSGVVLTPTTNVNYPCLFTQFEALIPGCVPVMQNRIEVWYYIPSQTIPSDGNGSLVTASINGQSPPAGALITNAPFSWYAYFGLSNYSGNSPIKTMGSGNLLGGTSSSYLGITNTSTDTTDNVYRYVLSRDGLRIQMFSGTMASGGAAWPAVSTLRYRATYFMYSPTDLSNFYMSSKQNNLGTSGTGIASRLPAPETVGPCIWGLHAASGGSTPISFTVARMLVISS